MGPLLDVNKQVIDCPKNMAGVLSAQYQSVFSLPRYMDNESGSLFPDEPESLTTLRSGSIVTNEG